ncbi:FecR domain-containing protein [Achromobacter xylosoxidans]
MAVVAPPFGLWPSWRELGADYRTAKGEQRRVVLPGAAVLDLNTRTSIALRAAGVELISGEAAISLAGASSPFTVSAWRLRHGAGRGFRTAAHRRQRLRDLPVRRGRGGAGERRRDLGGGAAAGL